MRVTKPLSSRTVQERWTIEGDSPVSENALPLEEYLSRSSHVESRLNLRGPSRKAKYSLTTDSKLVERLKDEKNPG